MLKIPRISSALKAVELKQVPAPLIIGERLNTQGSKKAKQHPKVVFALVSF